MKRLIKIIALFLIFGGLVWGGMAYHSRQIPNTAGSFDFAAVRRGDLVQTISATGTVEPEEVVDVGAQVAGQVLSFGKDKNGKTIDYGSVVETGMVLAKIDSSLYESDVIQVQAALAEAQANEQSAEANIGQLKAKLVQAESDWNRAQELGPSDALAKSSYDAYKAAYEVAKANVSVGEAALAQAKGAVLQADATLKRAQLNLGYCTIVSPVNGVIIDRRVNIGQTVVASLNAPSLFLIAKDLKRIQVWVSVNEADIGKIHQAQPVTFTVDALPDRTFRGQVAKIRLNATMTQNVVTYTVEVTADNSSGILLPYLTANAQFEAARKHDVLMVPNAALKWNPTADQMTADLRASLAKVSGRPGQSGLLWEEADGSLKFVSVHTGMTDGAMTEVEGNDLKDGVKIITGTDHKEAVTAAQETSTNPFTPQFSRGRQGARGSQGSEGAQNSQGAQGSQGARSH
jgi:HlyD family secretion protein